jgi:dTDP-glucose 4,6-dehydratase
MPAHSSIRPPDAPCYLVTGGAGFIGSRFVLQTRTARAARVVTLDALTYAGNPENLASLRDDPGHVFIRGDIGDAPLVAGILRAHRPTAVLNFAAESHVDRSIHDPDAFVRTNVLGTTVLLRESLAYWRGLAGPARDAFRFLHVSTDEVFGALSPADPPFTETTPYAPNSPYSASKAASDHMVRAFHTTYGLPVLLTNCSNNSGPRQFPEKLSPLLICNALAGRPLPVYGQGENVRDWLHVEDHCRAIQVVLERGRTGQTYAVGGRSELSNIALVRALCSLLDERRPKPRGSHADAVTFVADRPGHDLRYAVDCAKIETELGWTRKHTFMTGLAATLDWYLANRAWVERVQSGAYRAWLDKNYTAR